MTQIPTLKPQKLIKIIKELGFNSIRQEGSHIFFKHTDGRTTVIPFHAGKDIGKGLLREILKDIKISVKEIQQLM